MENMKKCSNKKHSELNAISYCLECNLYLCNKCSNYHNEYTDTHHFSNLSKSNQEIFKISGATGEGVEELMNHVCQVLKTLPKEQLVEIETNKEKVYTLDSKEDNEFKIVKEDNHTFVVTGEAVDRIMRRVNIADNESLFYLHRKLDEIGLNQALKKAGVKDGDNVKIAQYEMIWED